MANALVIGGTGPTGHFIVNGLIGRGFTVTILHTGRHEVQEIPASVEHIHADPFDKGSLATALEGRVFDLAVATYGRLRLTSQLLQGRVGRFVSIGGVPAYRGYSNAELHDPPGLPVPAGEDGEPVIDPSEDEKGYRVRQSEGVIFDYHPSATHFRYPLIYGPYQLVPREWSIVRRVLDRRAHVILPDGGLTLHHSGYAANVAHAVLLAVDQPDVASGKIYNCGDSELLSLRQSVDVIASALGHRWDVVSLPWRLATCAKPLISQPWTTHRVFDLTRIKCDLGYKDVVPPRAALASTANWLVNHPPAPGGPEERRLQDPFDYAAEDRLVKSWSELIASFPHVHYREEPGYTAAYSGPALEPRE